jgi:hypothetical protein
VPERLDRIDIVLTGGNVTISWDSRQALMRRLQHVRSTTKIRGSFDGVGASRPVQLSGAQRAALLVTLEIWARDGAGQEPMPQDLHDLRKALDRDLHHAEG